MAQAVKRAPSDEKQNAQDKYVKLHMHKEKKFAKWCNKTTTITI